MICPECGAEYREGFTRCADCEVDLVASTPPTPPDERAEIELVKVYETGNPALVAIVESLLNDGEIDFSSTSDSLQDLFAGGRLGGGFHYVIGPVRFYVRKEDEEDALAILATLRDEQEPPTLFVE